MLFGPGFDSLRLHHQIIVRAAARKGTMAWTKSAKKGLSAALCALSNEQLVVMNAPKEIALSEIRLLNGILGLDPDGGARE